MKRSGEGQGADEVELDPTGETKGEMTQTGNSSAKVEEKKEVRSAPTISGGEALQEISGAGRKLGRQLAKIQQMRVPAFTMDPAFKDCGWSSRFPIQLKFNTESRGPTFTATNRDIGDVVYWMESCHPFEVKIAGITIEAGEQGEKKDIVWKSVALGPQRHRLDFGPQGFPYLCARCAVNPLSITLHRLENRCPFAAITLWTTFYSPMERQALLETVNLMVVPPSSIFPQWHYLCFRSAEISLPLLPVSRTLQGKVGNFFSS